MREISAGIIVYRTTAEGPRFLILYHGHNYWNFPKGKIESEEKSFQTAVREVREETGLTRNDLRFNENFRTSENFTFWRNREKIYKTIVFYLAETGQQRIKLPEQNNEQGEKHEGYGWFTYKEALKVLTKEDSQRVLKQAYNYLRNLEVRKKSGKGQWQEQENLADREGAARVERQTGVSEGAQQRPRYSQRQQGPVRTPQRQENREKMPVRPAAAPAQQGPVRTPQRQSGRPRQYRPYRRPAERRPDAQRSE